jgi:carbon-monoxide dehydrogenase large subunit
MKVENIPTDTAGGYVGKPVPRREDERLLKGLGRYIDDLPEPSGLLYVGFLRSSYAHAVIRSIETDTARSVKGVHAIYTGADIAAWTSPMATPVTDGKELLRFNMAVERVRYVGEPVAAVVASSPYEVEDALELIDVDYDPLPTVVSMADAMQADATRLYDDLSGNVAFEARFSVPGTDDAFAKAPHVFADTFSSTRLSGVAMEMPGFVASFDKGQESLTLWSTAHLPHKERWEVAQALGLPERSVRIISPDVGGSFGLKTVTRPEVVVGSAISRHLGRPIKWQQDRQEDLVLMHARDFRFHIEIAVDDQGVLIGVRNTPLVNIGACPLWVTTAGLDAAGAGHHMMGPYKVPFYAYHARAVLTNTAPTASYRGVAAPICSFGMESLLERAATKLGIDAVEIRKRNLIQKEDLPYTNAVDVTHDTASHMECLERVLQRSDYAAFRRTISGKPGADGKLRGIGLACMADHTGQGTSITRKRGQASRWPGYDGALVKIEPDGKASVHISLASQGQGHATVFAQVAADRLGLRFEDVTVHASDTASVPFGTGAGASRGAVAGGGAVIKASTRIAEKMKRIAAHMLEADPKDIRLQEGLASVVGVPGMAVTIEQIAATAYMIGMATMPEGESIGLDAMEFYDPPSSTYAMASHIAQVAVDPGTGLVTVERYYVAHDCGRVLNPQIVDGQIVGAIVQGIGAVLMEAARYSEDGQPVATTLLDYTIPTMLDVPEIVLDHIETPSTITLGGMKGAGESGAVGVVPAIILAVTDALSAYRPSITSMPLTPSTVLGYMGISDPEEDA